MAMYPKFEFGYADHTGWDEAVNVLVTLIGAAQGMSYVEKHVTLVPGQKRTDSAAAISFERLEEVHAGMQILSASEGDGQLKLNEGEQKYCVFGAMKKAAVARVSIPAGEPITLEKIAFKRVGGSTDLSQLEAIRSNGKLAASAISAGQVLRRSDFA